MRARYYNPIAQRFISPDPIGLIAGQVNFYAYVFNQPTDWKDPLDSKAVAAEEVARRHRRLGVGITKTRGG